MIFIDMRKAYDCVPRELLWKALENKRVQVEYIRVIQDMYDEGVMTIVTTHGGETNEFPIRVGLSYLFNLVLNVLTASIQE